MHYVIYADVRLGIPTSAVLSLGTRLARPCVCPQRDGGGYVGAVSEHWAQREQGQGDGEECGCLRHTQGPHRSGWDCDRHYSIHSYLWIDPSLAPIPPKSGRRVWCFERHFSSHGAGPMRKEAINAFDIRDLSFLTVRTTA